MSDLRELSEDRLREIRTTMKRAIRMKVVGEILLSDDHLALVDIALGINRRALAAELLREVASEVEKGMHEPQRT